MEELKKKNPLKRILLILVAIILLLGVAKLCFELYLNFKEYTMEDIDGLWVATQGNQNHRVLYIHDGRMELVWYYDAEERRTNYDNYISMHMNFIPNGTFKTFSWDGLEEVERTGGGTFRADNEEKMLSFEFRRNKIYQKVLDGEIKYVRASEKDHPHILKLSKDLDQRYALSESALPLEIGEVLCFNRIDATEDTFDSFLCIQITNPNPFIIDAPYVKLSWEGHDNTYTKVLHAIPANHTGTYVFDISCRDILGLGNTVNPTQCSIGYNRYRVFEGEDKPIVEITDTRIIRDEKDGHVTQIEVDTKAADVSKDKLSDYDLFAIFYKNEKIVGVATGNGRIENIDTPDVMSYVSGIDDYDRYEICIDNHYDVPLFLDREDGPDFRKE